VTRIWSVAITALISCVAVTTAQAKPDFSRSRISISPTAPAEGDIVTFTLEVINSGDEDAPFTEVKFELPLEAMFIAVDGLENAEINPAEKVLGATVSLVAGASKVFRVRMVVPRDAAGRVLTPDLTVRYLHKGVEFYGHEVYDINPRVTHSGVKVGPVRVTPAGLAVLVFVVAFPLLWLAIRLMLPHGRVRDESGGMKGRNARNVGPATAAFALLLPLAFWTMFAAMAVRDWQSTHSWPQTSCVITDSRLREEQNSSGGSVEGGSLRRTRTTTTRSYQPLLALRYPVGGTEMVATGFQTGSHLRVGGRGAAESRLAGWAINSTVPCWYNPADAADVVVRNGFGGAYLFALFPLPIAAFGVYRTCALLRRR
jgi:hypothetical protein